MVAAMTLPQAVALSRSEIVSRGGMVEEASSLSGSMWVEASSVPANQDTHSIGNQGTGLDRIGILTGRPQLAEDLWPSGPRDRYCCASAAAALTEEDN